MATMASQPRGPHASFGSYRAPSGRHPACVTQFTGDSHYPGGPQACQADCAREGMQMSAFVYSGEFATSCVCRSSQPPAAPGATAPAAGAELDHSDDVTAAIGVVLQTRRNAAQNQSRR